MTVSIHPKGTTFVRMAIAKAAADGSFSEAADFAAARWGEASAPCRLLKAAVGAGATTSGNWAEDLVPEYAAAAVEFISLVRQASIIGRLNGLRRVPPRIPMLNQTGGASAKWVGQGKGIPVTSMAFARDVAQPLKVAGICVVTEELLNSGRPEAEAIIRADLIRAVAEASDLAFIDPDNAGVAGEQPASVTNGVTPLPASGDLKADLEIMVAGFDGDLAAAYWVGRPELFAQMNGIDFPNIGIRGGEILGAPALASKMVPNDAGGNYQLALIDPTGIVHVADEAGAEINVARHATIEMEDAPSQDSVTPTGTTTVSLWQVNAAAVGALLFENWYVRRSSSVSLLAGIAASEAAS